MSVKYRAVSSNGAINLDFTSSWSDSKGTYTRPTDKEEVDVVCIYCPDTGECYYVDPKAFNAAVSLRVRPSRNNQSRNVHLADHFREVPIALACRAAETGRRSA